MVGLLLGMILMGGLVLVVILPRTVVPKVGARRVVDCTGTGNHFTTIYSDI